MKVNIGSYDIGRAQLHGRLLVLLVALLLAAPGGQDQDRQQPRVLLFTKTEGERHDSIPAGQQAIMQLGRENGFAVDTTESASRFNNPTLARYSAVIFLNTTLEVLATPEQIALMRYIQAGGGFVGVHSAADTEYGWPWYGRLVGAYFDGHPDDPNVREGIISVEDGSHDATGHLPRSWIRRDEWYDYRYVNRDVSVLLTVDEKSYKRNAERPRAESHPIAWYHEFDGGRSFYTGIGHTRESYEEPLFRRHLLGGIRYAMGVGNPMDYSNARVRPLLEQFRKVILEDNLNEPMELDVLPDGRLLYIERPGRIRIHDLQTRRTVTAGSLAVTTLGEDGLLGVAVDPDHARNRRIYVYYSPADDPPRQRLSRLDLSGDRVEMSSEVVLLQIPTLRAEPIPGCCHSGGSLEFDVKGNLYLSTGDNTNPFESSGFAPVDERPDRTVFDAQRSASNASDLRGKILRIHPEDDGSYSIPEGNLFSRDGSEGRPEIYVMGNRNPFRISIDGRTGDLFWGEVGPDASRDSTLGPRGYDEINRATAAGNFGWPYAIADNRTYKDYDFAADTVGPDFDCVEPTNDSPNNTGRTVLPPCRPAWIWYPYDASIEFPLVGSGGRTAMAGPVFRRLTSVTDPGLPEYYDGKIFVYDWMRGWIAVVRLDSPGQHPLMEAFMPDHEFSRPMDMVIGPNGVMYLLEYGNEWNTRNPDARLTRIEYLPAGSYSRQGPAPILPTRAAAGVAPAAGHEKDPDLVTGEQLISGSDCSACHKVDEPSIGPSFVSIAKRYRGQTDVAQRLVNKVQAGGSGVWGQQPMIPHPQHTVSEIRAMVDYILQLEPME